MTMPFEHLAFRAKALHWERWGAMDAPLAEAIVRKVCEEATELAIAVASHAHPDDIDHEIGDVLFATIAACRIIEVDPTAALKRAIDRNLERWAVD